MGCMTRLRPVVRALLINGLCGAQPTGPVQMVRRRISEGISVVPNCQVLKDLL